VPDGNAAYRAPRLPDFRGAHPSKPVPFDMEAWRKEWGAYWGPKLREISAKATGRM